MSEQEKRRYIVLTIIAILLAIIGYIGCILLIFQTPLP